MHASLEPGGVLLVFPQCDERAIYLADPNGTLMVGHVEVPPLGAAVIAPGEEVQVYSPTGATDVLVMGGASLDAPVKHGMASVGRGRHRTAHWRGQWRR